MKTSIATVTLSGTLSEKLEAAANAGFQGVEIFENDLTQSDMNAREVGQYATDLGLDIIALQPLRDFEAMPDKQRQQNFFRARKKFDVMQELGAQQLLICSNVSPHAMNDPVRAAHDLHELAELAQQEGLYIGYEALAWGRYVKDYDQAWDIVGQADHDHLGIVLDSFHIFARDLNLDVLRDQIPEHKIALAQLADAPNLEMEVLYFSRHFRCFPGQGGMPIQDFVQCLKDKSYQGYWSHEIFNDDFRASSPDNKSIDGMRSMIWLDEHTDSSQETVAPPEISNVEFIEFAIKGHSGSELVDLLHRLGFQETHQHRSKQVTLMQQGDINLILNCEPESAGHRHYIEHGVSVCALGMATENSKAMIDRAERYHCRLFDNQAGPGELNIPAIMGVGDSLLYLLDKDTKYRFYDIDFVANQKSDADVSPGLDRVDHIGQSVPSEDFLSASLFYKTVLGFDIQPNKDLADIYGLVVSRVASSPNDQVRIPINMSTAGEASSQRFVRQTHGSGVQQIALGCDDIFKAVEQVGQDVILDIPDNYYRDLEARFALPEEQLERLQAHNVMYDQDESGGEFYHFYTRETHGVFFEVLQRIGYEGYGEANAHVRLAAQARLYKQEQERLGTLLSLY